MHIENSDRWRTNKLETVEALDLAERVEDWHHSYSENESNSLYTRHLIVFSGILKIPDLETDVNVQVKKIYHLPNNMRPIETCEKGHYMLEVMVGDEPIFKDICADPYCVAPADLGYDFSNSMDDLFNKIAEQVGFDGELIKCPFLREKYEEKREAAAKAVRKFLAE